MFTLYIVDENKKKPGLHINFTKDIGLRKKFKNTNSLVGLCYGHLSIITSGKAPYSVRDSETVRRQGFPHYARIVCVTTLAYGKRVL